MELAQNIDSDILNSTPEVKAEYEIDDYSDVRGRRKACRQRGLSGKAFRDCLKELRASDKGLSRQEKKALKKQRKQSWRDYKAGVMPEEGMEEGRDEEGMDDEFGLEDERGGRSGGRSGLDNEFGDMGADDDKKKKMTTWLIIGGSVLVLAVGGFLIFKKLKK